MKTTETSLSDTLNQTFGPYRLVSRLGVGGMAETFIAIRRGPGDFRQRVCLKLVLPFFREDEDFIRLFEREAKLAAKLRHRNIVGVIDFGEIDGTSFIAMELIDGADLRALIDAQPAKRLSPELTVLVGLELAEALEHAHHPFSTSDIDSLISSTDTQGIVHRDISPSNVLISRQGEVLLTDFGVAKAISGTSRKQSAVKGKVPYMAPEYLRGEALDGRSDLFSLGVVLFEALGGQRPYEGPHDPGTIMLILKGEHPGLKELAPEAPAELCGLIESLLKPDRDDRPKDAGELIEALDGFAPSPRVRRALGRLICELRDRDDGATRSGMGEPPPSGTELLAEDPKDQSGIGAPAPRAAQRGLQSQGKLPEVSTGGTAALPDSVPARKLEASSPTPGTPRPVTGAPIPPREGAEEPQSPPIALMRPPPASRLGETTERAPGAQRAQARSDRAPKPADGLASRSKKWIWLGVLAICVLGGAAGVLFAVLPPSDVADQPAAKDRVEDKIEEVGAVDRVDEVKAVGDDVDAKPGPVKRDSVDTPATQGSTRSKDVVEPTRPTRPAPERPAPVGERVEDQRKTEADKSTNRPSSRPRDRKPKEVQQKQPGRLTIAVIPWGDMWIDGTPWGPAPLRNEPLKPGTYRVSAGQGKPQQTRTVTIKPGQRHVVEFDLSK